MKIKIAKYMEPCPNQRTKKLFWKLKWQEWKIKQNHIHNPSPRPTVHHHLIWLASRQLGNTPPSHYLALSNVANSDLQMRKMPMKEICKSCVRARGVRRIVRTDCRDQQIDWYPPPAVVLLRDGGRQRGKVTVMKLYI